MHLHTHLAIAHWNAWVHDLIRGRVVHVGSRDWFLEFVGPTDRESRRSPIIQQQIAKSVVPSRPLVCTHCPSSPFLQQLQPTPAFPSFRTSSQFFILPRLPFIWDGPLADNKQLALLTGTRFLTDPWPGGINPAPTSSCSRYPVCFEFISIAGSCTTCRIARW